MRARRIYLPLTHEQLRDLAAERVIPAPAQGYAPLAPARGETRVDSRTSAAAEDAEYLAFAAAAGHAAALPGGRRRVVAAADAPERSLREVPAAAPSAVGVVTTEDLPLHLVVSLHIDEGAPAAEGAAGDLDLLWYDITELDAVLEGLGLTGA